MFGEQWRMFMDGSMESARLLLNVGEPNYHHLLWRSTDINRYFHYIPN